MKLFLSNAGKVGRVAVPGVPALVRIAGFGAAGVLVHSVNLGEGANFQIQTGLNNTSWIYSFGDKPGHVTVSGMAFPTTCNANVAGKSPVLDFYNTWKVSRKMRLVAITVGGDTFKGFLVDFTMNLAIQDYRVYTYSLNFITVPESYGDSSEDVPEDAVPAKSSGSTDPNADDPEYVPTGVTTATENTNPPAATDNVTKEPPANQRIFDVNRDAR